MVNNLYLRSALLTLPLFLAGCGNTEALPPEAPPSVVSTIIVEHQPVKLTADLPGRIEPVRVAEVRARVAGIVLSRRFEEGAQVKAGEVLFVIDPAPFKATLLRAEGELARAEASLFEAQATFTRHEQLVRSEAVSQQDYDTAHAALKSAEAAKLTAKADVETARLNLDYATVTAPISGRIGRANVTEGALVGLGEGTLLATIQQLDPVYVDFTQPVTDLVRIRTASEESGSLAADEGDTSIAISVEGSAQTREGRLLFTDITVDRRTGRVSMRGEVANADRLLLPGMYVRVTTSRGTLPAAVLIPQRAVGRGTDGKPQVLVVAQDNTVETRTVQTGAMLGANWHIASGLSAGDQVIVGGASRVQPGDKVEPQPENARL